MFVIKYKMALLCNKCLAIAVILFYQTHLILCLPLADKPKPAFGTIQDPFAGIADKEGDNMILAAPVARKQRKPSQLSNDQGKKLTVQPVIIRPAQLPPPTGQYPVNYQTNQPGQPQQQQQPAQYITQTTAGQPTGQVAGGASSWTGINLNAIPSMLQKWTNSKWGPFGVSLGPVSPYPLMASWTKLLYQMYQGLPPLSRVVSDIAQTIAVFQPLYAKLPPLSKVIWDSWQLANMIKSYIPDPPQSIVQNTMSQPIDQSMSQYGGQAIGHNTGQTLT